MAASDATPPPRPAPPGLGDLLALFGSNNPVAAMSKSVDQFRAGVTAFIEAVQTFRQTMDNLNTVAMRMNRLLDDVEEPVRTVIPEITRSADTAAKMIATLQKPVERVAPGLNQLADILMNPAVADLPQRLTDSLDAMGSIPRVLSPLQQMADMAGGLFGASRSLASLAGVPGGRSATPQAVTTAPARRPATSAPPKKAAAGKAPARKATAQRAASGKAATKTSTAKKGTAKKDTAKKGTAKKRSAKKASGKKS